MKTDDFLFIIDGLAGQLAMGRAYYEQMEMPTLPLDSIYASLATARALVEAEARLEVVDTGAEPDKCPHPPESVKRQLIGGGNYLLMCTACNEIIEQSGGDDPE